MDVSWPVRNLSYRCLIAIPLILAAVFAILIIVRGVPLSMDFAGGTHLSIAVENLEGAPDPVTLEEEFQKALGAEFEVYQTSSGYDVETSAQLTDNQLENQIKPLLHRLGVRGEYTSKELMGSVITDVYKEDARNAIIGAAIAMAIIIFIAIRHRVSVGGILLVVGLDALGALGGMALLRIPLSFGSVAGLLLLIGYAVDTNILLSTKVLKRLGGTFRDRAAEGMKTGLMMSGTSATALIAMYFVMTPPLIKEFAGALSIGILADIVNTWFLNSGILLWYAGKRERRYRGRI